MNYDQEYKSYGSYLSRVFAIIIAFLLLVAAIWFVVKLANDNNDESEMMGTSGGTSEVVGGLNDSTDGSDDTVAVDTEDTSGDQTDEDGFSLGDNADDDSTETNSGSDEDGQTLSTNTEADEWTNTDTNGSVAGSTTGKADDGSLPGTGPSVSVIAGAGVASLIAYSSTAVVTRRK